MLSQASTLENVNIYISNVQLSQIGDIWKINNQTYTVFTKYCYKIIMVQKSTVKHVKCIGWKQIMNSRYSES